MIKCPQCGWKFRHQVQWQCDECRTPFYTFDHHGVCPSCGHDHDVTLCPNCRVWSRHEDWYHTDDEPTLWERVLGIGKTRKKKNRE